MGAGRPLKYQTVEELQSAVDAYFRDDCMMKLGDAEIFAPTMGGLACALGVSRQTLVSYRDKDEFLDTIKNARSKIGAALEQRLYSNSVAGVIFNLKNNFEWKDKQEVETKDVTHEVTDEDLNAKILEMMDKLK